MLREQLPPHKSGTYALERWRTVYVSVPKAACTSMKWLVAGLQGERPERFYGSMSREVTRANCIHRRSLWQHTPMLHLMDDDELARIDLDAGWFSFAVVRHPGARLWSGWQAKFLLQEPRFLEKFAGAPWLPDRIPTSSDEVVESFHRFAASLRADPRQPVARDRHFRTQVELLRPDAMPFTRIYQTGQIPALLADLGDHLRPRGFTGTLELGRNNETPLRPVRDLFSDDVVKTLEEVYGVDYERFGYADVLPGGYAPESRYDDDAITEVGLLVERTQRIGDLAVRGQVVRAELGEVQERAAQLEKQVGALQVELRATKAAAAPAGLGARLAPPRLRKAVRRRVRKVRARLGS